MRMKPIFSNSFHSHVPSSNAMPSVYFHVVESTYNPLTVTAVVPAFLTASCNLESRRTRPPFGRRPNVLARLNSPRNKKLAPRVGFEPTACRLTADQPTSSELAGVGPNRRKSASCELNLTNHFLLLCSPFVRDLSAFIAISTTFL